MTRTISLIIGIAVSALAVSVPVAFGEGQLGGSNDPGVYAPDWFERAAIAAQNTQGIVSAPDSHEVTQPFTYVDAPERADIVSSYRAPSVGLSGDHVDATPTSVSTPVASSGTELDWPQIGIGLGVGLALAFGLLLAFRMTRPRSLAH